MAEQTKKPVFEIYHDEERERASGGRKAFSFRVDGVESMWWGPTQAAVVRTVNRLREGKSGEAFGGAGIVQPGAVIVTSKGHDKPARAKVVKAGEVVIETVTMKSGKQKVREKQPGFIYELDGVAHEGKVVTTETEARGLAAAHAFMTRSRLGRFAEAEAQFKDQTGKVCKVQVLDLPGSALHRKIVAKDEDGGLWHVGFDAGVNRDKIKFVAIVPAPPSK